VAPTVSSLSLSATMPHVNCVSVWR